MSTQDSPFGSTSPGLAALPSIDDLPISEQGYDPERVREAYEAFHRHAAQLHAQLRVLQTGGGGVPAGPTGHSVRMDALNLIKAAAEFADTLEEDAQKASAAQLARAEEEIRRRQGELRQREEEVERALQESERQRAELLNGARSEAQEVLAAAQRDSSQELRDAEARATRLLEQARHQATELTNSARADVEETLEWAHTQASAILTRAQQGAEQLLQAAGLGDTAVAEVSQAVVQAALQSVERGRSAEPAPSPAQPSTRQAPAATVFFSAEVPEPPVPEPEPGTGAAEDREGDSGREQ